MTFGVESLLFQFTLLISLFMNISYSLCCQTSAWTLQMGFRGSYQKLRGEIDITSDQRGRRPKKVERLKSCCVTTSLLPKRVLKLCGEMINAAKLEGIVCPAISFSSHWGLPVLLHSSVGCKQRMRLHSRWNAFLWRVLVTCEPYLCTGPMTELSLHNNLAWNELCFHCSISVFASWKFPAVLFVMFEIVVSLRRS